jgi:hypothetical protein
MIARSISYRSIIAARFRPRCSGGNRRISEAQTVEISRAKEVIYDGFNAALAGGLPKETSGILVDEQFGAGILRDASTRLSSALSDRTRSRHYSSKEG